MNPFDLFNRSQGEKQRKRNNLKNASLQIAALGGAGYAASKLLEGAKLQNSLNQIKNSSTLNSRELGVAGQKIREDLDILQNNLSKSLSEKLKSSIIEDSKLEEILGDGTKDISERRAMLAALFDTYSMELDGTFDEGIRDRIKAAYETDSALTKQDIDSVKTFYGTAIKSDQEALNRFNSRYKRTRTVADLLDGDLLKASTQVPTKQIRLQDIGNMNLGVNKSFVENSFKAIQGKFGASNVFLEQRDMGTFGKSIEAKINFKGSKIPLYIPLQAGATSFGNPVFAGASSGSTLYSGPLKILDAVSLKNAGFQKKAGQVPGMKRFEQVIVEELLRGGDLIPGANFNKYNINEFYSYMRSFGTDLPSTVALGNTAGMQDISKTLLTSKAMEGSAVYIQNIDKTNMSQKQVLNFMLKNMGDIFGGPGSAQTVTTSIEDPFDRTKRLSYSQVQLLSNQGNKTLNPLANLMSFGRDQVDRALQPQTAREQQLIGRYEFLHSEKTMNQNAKFGRLDNINVFGSGKQLMGINPVKNAEIRGANLGMFMVIGDESAKLGLSEGSAYSGGKFSVKTALTKTVSQQGIEKFKLMSLLEDIETKKVNDGFLKVGSQKTNIAGGYYNIDDFFKEFGKKGEAILGYRDAGFSVIKRHKGLEEFTIGITKRSEMGGRKKVHLGGSAVKSLENMKLFSGGFKGTLEYASESDVETRLKNLGLGNQYAAFKEVSRHQASVFTDESMIKKSSQYLGMQIFGGFKLFGGDQQAFMSSMTKKIGQDDEYLKMINALSSGAGATDLSSANVKSRQGAFLNAMIESVLENTSYQDASGVKKQISSQELGMILGGVQKLGSKFGLEQSEIDTLIKTKGSSAILAEAEKGVAAGAMYASSGDVYSDLGRNLARIEPRFANYLYQSLRSNFDFTSDEATKYISSLIARQEGSTEKAAGSLGMKLSAFSLGNMKAEQVSENLDALTGGVKRMSSDEIDDLITKVGREREIGEQLSESKSGNILETNKLGLSGKAQSELEKALSGKKSFFLAGEETYEGLKGHIIRSQGEDINIANEYLRYTNDLVGAVSSLRDAGDDEKKIRSAIKGFETSKTLMGKTAANTIRNVLSGKVLGSGTYRGRGISLGKGNQGNIGGKIMSTEQNALMKKIFDKTAGYAIVSDTQAFMDGMSSFKEAARRDMMRSSGKTDVKQEVNELMGKTLRNFFLGIYQQQPVGVVVDSQRNPIIGMGNIFANIEMFSGGEDSEAFDNFFRRGSKFVNYEKTDATKAKFKKYKQEELNKLKYKDTVSQEKQKIINELAKDGKLSVEEKKALSFDNGRAGANIAAEARVKPVIGQFAKKHDLKLDNYDEFNKFLGIFLGNIGEEGSVSKLSDKQDRLDYLSGARKQREQDITAIKGGGRDLSTMTDEELLQIEKSVAEDKMIQNIDLLSENVRSDKFNNNYGLDISTHKDLIRTKNFIPNLTPPSASDEIINAMDEGRAEFYKDRSSGTKKVNVELNKLKSKLHNEASAEAQTRMKNDNVYENLGNRKVKSFSSLKKLEESFIASGQAPKDFSAKDEGFRFSNFEEIFEAEQKVKGTSEEKNFTNILQKQFRNMAEAFVDRGSQGGGTISFFDVKVSSADLIGKDGKVLGTYSGRADISRAGIGDFDGDIYQVFFRTDDKSVRGKGRVAAPQKMFGQALSMDILLGQLSKGMKNLGSRMGADNMDIVASQISEKEKERILKGVGGVDIDVKTLMMGLAQSASDEGDPDNYFKSMKGGMALLASMQEQLVIQAKKLPMASNTPEAFTTALKAGFREGHAGKLKDFLTENILKGTELLNARQLKVSNLNFENIDISSPGGKIYKQALENVLVDLDEIFDSLDKGMAAVKNYGIDKMPSTNRLMRNLVEGRVADSQMLSNLLSASMTMEGGVIGGKEMEALSAVNRIMQGIDSGTKSIGSSFAQKAGAIGVAAGLVASGAIGSMMSRGEINPEGVFSDMRVRENMSMRSLQENMNRDHRNVSPQGVGGPQDNFHERPILSGETSVVSNVSTRFYGESPSLSNGVSMARQFVSAGGQAAMHVNDTRMPISNSYITKSIRD